jgi:hypothetical protein
MPAVNTPQFSWVLCRLPKRPRPVAPIYQPELAARAVLFAADHPRRREHWVGSSTMATLAANAVVPGVLDRYLARTGFSSQQTDKPTTDRDPANLWRPSDGPDGHDFGARGKFDNVAHDADPQLWASHHHGWLSAALAGIGAAGLMLVARSKHR